MRLFSFATAEKRTHYLWVLRAFDHARGNYTVLLHAGDVETVLNRIAADGPGDVPEASDLPALLEQLHAWGVLERSYDGTRAATLAEYRNRHYVYQFGQAGYRAFRAVEDVLSARGEDVSLSRLALADLLADLTELADANAAGDGELVYRKLSRLDATLSDMAERAARFYLVLGDLVRTTEITPEVFLDQKDALLTHMREFSSDLARYAPKLTAALDRVHATGADTLHTLAAQHDERVLLSFEEREADWRMRWRGVEHWFVGVGSAPSESERLRGATINAISAVLSLLRRLTEQRRGGVSRESQLRHLAGWFANSPTEDAAHALFGAVFDLGRPRHFSIPHPDADVIPVTRSWWEVPPVEIARTLAETGRRPAAGAPGRIQRNDAGVRRLREKQLETQRRRAQAAKSLAAGGVRQRELSEPEAEVLLSLLDAALSARVPVSGRVRADEGSSGTQNGVKLTLRPSGESMVVRTARGSLYLDHLSVEVQ
ncbi:TIGR02677 family protein [Rhodococcus artemisiae]|uniref:TIGR02677 family protein n=1 Tax=Rhodococcus artemisiae TaxID=714159 RepID=UPI002E7AE6CC|nr:TIGR02677 family protein [Rhodococcus artemisiae]